MTVGLSLVVALGLLGAFAAPAMAAEPLPAIGRLNHAGYSKARHCTFAAVAPRVAVTASHCLQGVPAEELHLLYGYSRMTWTAEQTVASTHEAGPDLSVLCLAEDAPAALGVGATPAREAMVRVVGYGRPRVHVQQSEICRVWTPMEGELLLDCPAAKGMSGGPVLDLDDKVVGVMSRTGRGSSVAAQVSEDVVRLCIGADANVE